MVLRFRSTSCKSAIENEFEDYSQSKQILPEAVELMKMILLS